MRRFNRYRARPLFDAEYACLVRYFGGNLDYSRLRLRGVPWRRASCPWGGVMLFPRAAFEDADAARPLALGRARVRRVLVHEATHAWQRQHGDWVSCRALPLQLLYLMGRNVYAYASGGRDPAQFLERFLAANIEQQAKMVEDAVAAEQRGLSLDPWERILDYLKTRPLPRC